MKPRAPTVYVVDDDDAVRNSLRLLLRSSGIDAVTHASATEFLTAHDEAAPGCLLLDVRMPDMTGLELQRQLHRRGVSLPIIFITGHGDIPMAVDAMRLGAFDFLQKPFRDEDLLDRVRRALEHDRLRRLERQGRDDVATRIATLTPREREVMALVTRGLANKVIAADLGLSQRTVEIHRSRVMEKMGAASLAQLVRMTLELTESQPVLNKP